jgi:hypothetical protein
MVSFPVALASVVTPGTSWSPVRVTGTSAAFARPKLAASSIVTAARWRIEFVILGLHRIIGIRRQEPGSERLRSAQVPTIRREYLDHVLFWNRLDLQRKLDQFASH